MRHAESDSEALQERLAAFAPRVYGLLIRLIGRRDVAEDLTQETLLRAFRGLKTYHPEGKFRAWIFRIATNAARDWVRRQGRETVLSLENRREIPLPDRGAAATPDSGLARRERTARLEAALARLPQPDREVILLRFYGELAFKEIAEATGEPLGTVLARAHRALKKLGDLIPEEEL